MNWISVTERLPTNQCEVVFYAKPYEWWTGLFTPQGNKYLDPGFAYHQHWGDDQYHVVEGVLYWMPLPDPILSTITQTPETK